MINKKPEEHTNQDADYPDEYPHHRIPEHVLKEEPDSQQYRQILNLQSDAPAPNTLARSA